MSLRLDIQLTADEIALVARTDPRWWFTHIVFTNAESPRHPEFATLEANNEHKRTFVRDWLARVVPGSSVLDTFCANGAFSFEAARLGATRVVGVDLDMPRIECATLLATLLRNHAWSVTPQFYNGNVYALPDVVRETFDVTLMLGGLYHVSDPVLVMKQARKVTRRYLIVQTSRVPLWAPRGYGWFAVRQRNKHEQGCTSMRSGLGVWSLSPGSIEAMLSVAGFRILESRRPPLTRRHRFPWYGCLAEAV